MKKIIFNIIFYCVCFLVLFVTIYRLAFTVPPEPGMVGYKGYFWGTIVISVVIGLMVIIPNLVIEFLLSNWFPEG